MSKTTWIVRIAAFVLTVFSAGGVAAENDTIDLVPAATPLFQQMGSTGAIDESSLGRFAFRDADLYVRDGRTGTVIARYDIGCPLELEGSGEFLAFQPTLEARYKDDGPRARVVLSVRRTSFETGETDTVLRFDSNDAPSAQGYNVLRRAAPVFECERYGYMVEARLTKDGGGDPRLQTVRIVAGARDDRP